MERTRRRIGLRVKLEDIRLDLTKLPIREEIMLKIEEFEERKKRFSVIQEYLIENSYRGIRFTDLDGSYFLAVSRIGCFSRLALLEDIEVKDAFSECQPMLQTAFAKEFDKSNIFTIENHDGKPVFKIGDDVITSYVFEFVKPYNQDVFPFDRTVNYHNGFPTSPDNPERLVICAGGISFIDGKISDIDNKSGHFCPDAKNNIINTIKVLAKMLPEGVKLIDCFDKSLIEGKNLVFRRNHEEKDYVIPIAVINAISERYSSKKTISSR